MYTTNKYNKLAFEFLNIIMRIFLTNIVYFLTNAEDMNIFAKFCFFIFGLAYCLESITLQSLKMWHINYFNKKNE